MRTCVYVYLVNIFVCIFSQLINTSSRLTLQNNPVLLEVIWNIWWGILSDPWDMRIIMSQHVSRFFSINSFLVPFASFFWCQCFTTNYFLLWLSFTLLSLLICFFLGDLFLFFSKLYHRWWAVYLWIWCDGIDFMSQDFHFRNFMLMTHDNMVKMCMSLFLRFEKLMVVISSATLKKLCWNWNVFNLSSIFGSIYREGQVSLGST